MSTKYEAEAELRRQWGAGYEARIDNALDAFDLLPGNARKRIDQNSPSHIQALAALKSEAYSNAKHPEHAKASALVQEHFNRIHNDPNLVF